METINLEKELPMTGERMVTSFSNQFGMYEHLHRYALAMEFTNSKTVIDIACGEGYGTNLISLNAEKVIGVDISDQAIGHAKEKYKKSNISFQKGSASDIPCEENIFDVAVSYETIEHHLEHEKMFTEIKRILKKDGLFIISSPDKENYHLRDPNNQFHVKELTLEELLTLVKKYFKTFVVLQQQIIIGSLISPLNGEKSNFTTFDGDFYNITKNFKENELFNVPFINVIICSDYQLNLEKYSLSSIFSSFDVFKNTLLERDEIIEDLKNQITTINCSILYKIFKYIVSPKKIFKRIFKSK